MCASSAANNLSIRVIRCYAVQGPNLRPILCRKNHVIRPFKVSIGILSAYTKLSIRGREQRYLRPRVVLPSAASSITRGRKSIMCQ